MGFQLNIRDVGVITDVRIVKKLPVGGGGVAMLSQKFCSTIFNQIILSRFLKPKNKIKMNAR